jgi:hypothetical protein
LALGKGFDFGLFFGYPFVFWIVFDGAVLDTHPLAFGIACS